MSASVDFTSVPVLMEYHFGWSSVLNWKGTPLTVYFT